MHRRMFFGFVLTAALCLSFGARAATPKAKEAENLELQVAALNKLHELELTGEQLAALEKVAAQVTADKSAAARKIGAPYSAALTAVRDAMLEGDEAKIVEAEDKLDELRESKNIDPQEEVEITDSARKQAPAALNVLTATQIAGYLAQHSDDVPDALQTMMDAIDESRGMADADYMALRTEAVSQVGLLVGGLTVAAQEAIAKRVGEWLDRARAMNEADIKSKHAQLEASAKQIIGKADPMQQLRHWLEREMADLLSNPELVPMISARRK